MMMRRLIGWASACVLAWVLLVPMQAQRSAAGAGGQAAGQQPGARGGQRGGGGGGGDAPVLGQGTLIAGAWGADPLAVDSRGWGWMARSYVSANHKGPFWNKAKELLFSGKQV